jgi:23S rRNA-/tRNA-specific pseudouridylate synthase
MLSLSLVYTATVNQYPNIAANVLERAVRLVPRTKSPTSQLQPNSFIWKEQMVKTYGIQMLHDNDELAILNKPSGMELFECVSPTRRVTKTAAPSLEALLLKQGMELYTLNLDGSRGFVHRLDVGTLGCLVVAKTNSMHAKLISKFFLRQV